MPLRLLKNKLRVLLVEDNATDTLLVQDELAHAKGVVFQIEPARRFSEAALRLAEHAFDIVLLDLSLPDSEGLVTYTHLQALAPGVPIVVLSHRADEALALDAMRAGAQDYLVKGQAEGLLVRSIRYAIGRAQSELALRVSEARWAAALEGVGDGVWDWDVPSQTVFFSRRWKAMLGYAEADISNAADEWFRRVHPDDMPAVMARLQPHLDGDSARYTSEHRMQCKDGHYTWVLGRGMVVRRDAGGKALRMVGTHTDISARREQDEQLRLLQASLAHINDMVVITSANPQDTPYPRIVYVNDAFVRRTGYTRDEVLGKTPRLLQGAHTQRAELDRITQAMRRGEPVEAELINYTRSGEAFWLELEMVPIKRADGQVTHFVAVERDVSERKEAARKLQAGVVALEDSQRQLQTLARRILNAQETERRRVALELHDELGQTLTAMKINLMAQSTSTGQAPSALDAENIRIVEDALQQVRRLALALRPSMLDDLGLKAALNWLAQAAASSRDLKVNLRCTMASDRIAPEIETACFRIVQESLTNIRRHARATTVDIVLVTDDDSLDVTVHDDGVGFDLAANRDRTSAGYSLGLLGLRERALGIGGQVTIETAPGRGCTVHLHCALDAALLATP